MSDDDARRSVLLGVTAGAAVGFVLLAVLYPHQPLSSADADVVRWMAENRPGWAVTAARAASSLGTWSAWVVGIGLTLALLVTRRFRDAAWAALAFAGVQVLTELLKVGFDRERPHGAAVALPGSPSFPSGHASGAVVTFGVLVVLAAELRPPYRHLLYGLAALTALAIGASRIVLGVHFTTDVLAGWCLGVAWLAAALLVRDALPRTPVVARSRGRSTTRRTAGTGASHTS